MKIVRRLVSNSAGPQGSHPTIPDAHTGTNLFAKGSGLFGALGRGDFHDSDKFLPVFDCPQLPPHTKYRSVSAGWGHTAATTESGDLVVFGRPFDFDAVLRMNNIKKVSGALARFLTRSAFATDSMSGIFSVPKLCLTGHNIVSTSCSAALTMALSGDGHVFAFGSNRWGQCARPVTHKENLVLEAAHVPLPSGAIAIDTGLQHCIVLDKEGDVYCWGKGHRGQIGGVITDEYVANPVRVGTLKDIVGISAGFAHCAAVDANGALYIWGKGMSDIRLPDGMYLGMCSLTGY
jgi:alpha-tubulin suppressor-like RCC1 family protein